MKVLNYLLIALVSMALVFNPLIARAEDTLDDKEEDVVVNDESASDAAKTESDVEEGLKITSSPFVKTSVLFLQPQSSHIPAGRLVKLVIGFHNNGTSGFVVDSIEGSFRYPQDYQYYIQNFTTYEYVKLVEADKQATFEYAFTPSETFATRQFGLSINLRYRGLDGKLFANSIFNETVNIIEPEEGLDGETFLLYIFLAAIVVLLAIVAQQSLSIFKKKGRSKSSYSAQKLSNGNGAASTGDVDMEWIPKEHLQTNKSPKVSPRQRRSNGRTNGNAVSSSGNSSNDER